MLDRVVVRFAGDSGDGMQLTGDRFTSVSARRSATTCRRCPSIPAEIRAPAGTVHGVSSFQVHISDHQITTPGDEPNVLVAMNPAALRADLDRLEPGGTLIVNEDAFDERNLDEGRLPRRQRRPPSTRSTTAASTATGVIRVPMTSLTKEATAPLGVKPRDAERSKNFFALGLVSWMYSPPDRADARVDREALRQQRAGARPPTGPRSSPASTSARPPRPSATASRSARRRCRPASTRASPATPPWRGASSPPASSPSSP